VETFLDPKTFPRREAEKGFTVDRRGNVLKSTGIDTRFSRVPTWKRFDVETFLDPKTFPRRHVRQMSSQHLSKIEQKWAPKTFPRQSTWKRFFDVETFRRRKTFPRRTTWKRFLTSKRFDVETFRRQETFPRPHRAHTRLTKTLVQGREAAWKY